MLYFNLFSATLLLFASASAAKLPSLEARTNPKPPAWVSAVFSLPQASTFCSRFVPIRDITTTVTRYGAAPTQKVAAKRDFLNHVARGATTTSSSSRSSTKASTTRSGTSNSRCAGAPSELIELGCDLILDGCLAFVRPRTQTVSDGEECDSISELTSSGH